MNQFYISLIQQCIYGNIDNISQYKRKPKKKYMLEIQKVLINIDVLETLPRSIHLSIQQSIFVFLLALSILICLKGRNYIII